MNKTITRAIVASCLLALLPAQAQTASNKTEAAQNLSIFNAIFKELQTNYVDSIDATKSVRNAIDGMLGEIDPYTEYFSVDEQDEFNSIASGEFSGIGSYLTMRNGRIVMSPQWDSPSHKAGMRHGDRILAIDGDTLPTGFTSAQATKLLRGQAGTHVLVTVERPYATDSIIDLDIIRGTIRTEPVPYYGMVDDHTGYISLTTFNQLSADQVRQALVDLKKNPDFKSLILDLRDNGGGLLESAVQIAGYFVPKGTEIVRTRYRNKKNEKIYKTTQQPIDTRIPIAVLVNGNTASAAEIVSGALQDLDRAVVIGDRTYGKGLVQSTRPIPYEGLLKVTVARYYIPSGRLIQAIDYSHRNPDGSVARIPDSLTNVYHTAAGRQVRDGGGITPDIKVEHRDINRLMYNVIVDNWAYDYATRYAARQGDNQPSARDFVITDSIFADFKSFIDPARFKYDRLSESGLKMLREAATEEGYMTDSVSALFDQLEILMRHDLNHDLDHNREELSQVIDSEISQRYYSNAEVIMRTLVHDDDVIEAAKLLSEPAKYAAILKPKVEDGE